MAGALAHHAELADGAHRRWAQASQRAAHAMVDQLFDQRRALGTAARTETGSGFTRMAMELDDLPGHPAREVATRGTRATVQAGWRGALAACGTTQTRGPRKACRCCWKAP